LPVAAAVLAARWWSRAVLARLAEVALYGLALLTAVHQAAVAMLISIRAIATGKVLVLFTSKLELQKQEKREELPLPSVHLAVVLVDIVLSQVVTP
jgi:hypothetical protein